jgi:hypothetical protein
LLRWSPNASQADVSFFSSWRTSTSVALEDISSFALATTAATWGSGEKREGNCSQQVFVGQLYYMKQCGT